MMETSHAETVNKGLLHAEEGRSDGHTGLLTPFGGVEGFRQVQSQQRREMLQNTGVRMMAAGLCTAVLFALAAAEINSERVHVLDNHNTAKWTLLGFFAGALSYLPVRAYTVQKHSTEDRRNMTEFFVTPAVNLPMSALMLLVFEQSFAAAGDALAVSALGNGHAVLAGLLAVCAYSGHKAWKYRNADEPALDLGGYTAMGTAGDVGADDVLTYDLNAFVAGDVGGQSSNGEPKPDETAGMVPGMTTL